MAAELVGHWSFDEASGDFATDSSGHNNHLILKNLTASSHVRGKVNNAIHFVDSRNQDASVDNVSSDLKPGSVTLSAWINPEPSNEDWEWIAAQGDNYGLYIQPNNRRLIFYKKESGGWEGVESPGDSIGFDQWQHVTGSFDATSGKLTIYIDGDEVASNRVSNEIVYNEGNGFTIGSMQGGRGFTGDIDDVQVHDVALSQSNVTSLFNNGSTTSPTPTPTLDTTAPVIVLRGENPVTITEDSSYSDSGATATDDRDGSVDVSVDSTNVNLGVPGSYTVTFRATDNAGNVATATRTVIVEAEVVVPAPTPTPTPSPTPSPDTEGLVGHWNFDEATGSLAGDTSGNNNHLTLNNLTANTHVTGKIANAINLVDSRNQDASKNTVSNDLKPESVTISAWVNPVQSNKDWEWIAAQGDNYGLYLQPNNRRLVFYKKESNGWEGVESPVGSIEFDQWQHVTGSFDATSGTLKVYIESSEVASNEVSQEIIYNEGNGFTIGSMQGGRGFTGVIDDVRVYNKALSQARVNSLFLNSGSTTPAPDTTAPVITLLGLNPVTITEGGSYTDSGATATDNVDGVVNVSIDSTGVNEAQPGSYTVTFRAVDDAGNVATATRTVIVEAEVVVPTPTPAPTPTPEVEGLVGYWGFDETTGNLATDSSGKNNDLTLNNLATSSHVAGKISNAINFIDNNNQDASTNTVSNDLKPGSVTVSAWVNPVQSNQEWEWIAAQGDNYGLYIQPNNRRLVFYKKESSGWQGVESLANGIEFGQWQHVAGSFDATSGKLRVYIDGNEVASGNGGNEIVYNEGNGFTIGSMQGGRGFTGIIDDVRVYDRALSASQIAKVRKSKGSGTEPTEDTTAPFITLQGSNPTTILKDSIYTDPGATASDNVDVNVTVVVDASAVNTSTEGSYTVTYTATDVAGNQTQLTRTVIVTQAVGHIIDKSFFDNSYDGADQPPEGRRGSVDFNEYVDPDDPGAVADWLTESAGEIISVNDDASFTAALAIARPGDRIQLQTGRYRMQSITVSGESGRPITIESAINQWAIFDGSITGSDVEISIQNISWVNFRAFEVMNGAIASLFATRTHHCLFEGLRIHNNGLGLEMTDGCHHSLIRLCESYHNFDRTNHGQNGDGFGIWSEDNALIGEGIILEHNISWANADDGIDMWMNGTVVTMRNNIVRNNGYNVINDPSYSGNGNGFKLGPRAGGHIVIGNIADSHPQTGFDYNGGLEAHYLKGNIAVNNGRDYNIPNSTVFEDNVKTGGEPA